MPPRTRQRYIPIPEAEAGMVLYSPANAVRSGSRQFSLPAGHTLTEDNLHQLQAHHVEYIYISEPDQRSDEQVAEDTAGVAGRVLRIFGPADMEEPVTAALFEQVLAYRNH